MLYAGAFSCATRFISLSAVKASVVKKFEVEKLLLDLSVFTEMIIVLAFSACLYHVGAGMMVYQEARREEHFAWYVQLARGRGEGASTYRSHGAVRCSDIPDGNRHQNRVSRFAYALPRDVGGQETRRYSDALARGLRRISGYGTRSAQVYHRRLLRYCCFC
ncbi:hypothetical protein MTO96_017011 [Rhipicephalus appendiculatus]